MCNLQVTVAKIYRLLKVTKQHTAISLTNRVFLFKDMPAFTEGRASESGIQ